MSNFPRRSFAAGELDPALYARTDWSRYAIGARTVRNFYVGRSGGCYNRPGTKYTGTAREDADARLIPFESPEQQLLFEFGPHYVRVYETGAIRSWGLSGTITAITKANPAVVTSVGHPFADGEEVYIESVGGMTQVNGNYYVIVKLSADTFSLHTQGGVPVDSSAYTAYGAGGTATLYGKPHGVDLTVTPAIDPTITGVTQANPAVVTCAAHGLITGQKVWIYGVRGMTQVNGSVYQVTRLTANTFSLQTTSGTNVDSSAYTAYSSSGRWSMGYTSTELSEIQFAANDTYTGLLVHRYHPTRKIGLAVPIIPGSAIGLPYYLGVSAYSTKAGTTTAVAVDPAGTGYIVVAAPVAVTGEEGSIESATQNIGNSATNVKITATITAGVYEQIATNFYIKLVTGGPYVFFGSSSSNVILVPSVASLLTSADYARSPQIPTAQYDLYAGGTTGGYPSVIGVHAQRTILAASDAASNQAIISVIGNTYFPVSSVQTDISAFAFQIPQNRDRSQIRHILGMRRVVIITAGGVFIAKGNGAGILTPTEINLEQHSYFGGAKYPQPVIIGDSALYLQAQGNIVRDLAFEFQSDGYRGNDLTVNSAHLVDGYTLSDWTFQDAPNSILWSVRSDGKLLSLTYIKEQQMIAWARHDTDGSFLRAATLKESENSNVYFVVSRTINGSTKRYIEKLYSRVIGDIEDCVYMDSAKTTDGTNTATTTMTLSGGTNWTYDELLTMTASVAYFASTDVGNEMRFRDATGVEIRFTISNFTSTTVVTGHADRTVPTTLRSTARSTWGKAITVVTGLSHLEGEAVAVFADGFVVASPNNSAYSTLTVASGQITLPRPYEVIQVGLPYTSDLETLDIDTPDGESLSDKRKLITAVTSHVYKTRSFWVGGEAPATDAATTTLLTEAKIRYDEDPNEPVDLQNGDIEVNMQGHWSEGGRVFMRNVDPVPCAILSVIPTGLVPFRGG